MYQWRSNARCAQGLPTVLVHYRLWRFRTRLWRTITRQRWEKIMSNQQKTIAVVDDDPEMRCAMRNLLSALGYIGKTYDTAKTFLNCASTCEASCLVLDIQLGDISGIELAHRLAVDGFRFPIIFMTGLDDATIRKKAVAAGA